MQSKLSYGGGGVVHSIHSIHRVLSVCIHYSPRPSRAAHSQGTTRLGKTKQENEGARAYICAQTASRYNYAEKGRKCLNRLHLCRRVG